MNKENFVLTIAAIGVVIFIIYAIFTVIDDNTLTQGIVLEKFIDEEKYVTTEVDLGNNLIVPVTSYVPETYYIVIKGKTKFGRIIEKNVLVSLDEYNKFQIHDNFIIHK